MKANAEKEAAELHASTQLEVEKNFAEANLTGEQNRADASRVMSNAEGIVAPYLAKKNIHTTNLKQIDVYRNLASNRNLILSDASDDDSNLVAVADSILSDSAGGQHASRSAVMAQLSLMNRGASGLFTQTGVEHGRDIQVHNSVA